MPAYEYACQSCGDHFSLRQKMSDPEVQSCPKCGGSVHRLISGGAGVNTKGGAAPAPACGMGACCSREMQNACGCAE
ncbi:MAG: FmdB family zinc ribbon protein [Acidobacteriota bacterium]